MNTVISITVVVDKSFSTIEVQDAIEVAFGEFDRIVKRFTRFNRSSELAHLNRNQGKWYEVSEEMIMLVQKMIELAKESDGAFDPTIIDFLEAYGYNSKYDFSKLGTKELEDEIIKLAKTRPSWRELEVDSKSNKIKLAKNQRIDLGGIGKGYAIDCAAEHLMKFENFSINAGGDIRVHGHNDQGKPWRMALKHKIVSEDGQDQEVIVGDIESSDTALASSGSWARKVKNFHHIINPQTGQPVGDLTTVFVTAPDAASADSWATALFVGGDDLLKKLPKDVAAALIYADNKVKRTENFLWDKLKS